jgi:hypothetical protein
MDSQELNPVELPDKAKLPAKTIELRRLASQGDPKAIQQLLAQTLAHKQIQVQARVDDGKLEILLSSATLPKPEICLKLLGRELLCWHLAPQRTLSIVARQSYQNAPVGWQQDLSMVDLPELAWGKRVNSPTPLEPEDDQAGSTELLPQAFEQETWKALGAGIFLAMVLMAFGQLKFIFSYFITVVHELGHTAVSWLFGFPAIPAFDFLHGGGVSMQLGERYFVVVWSLYATLGYLLYRYRRNTLTLQILITVGLAYTWLAFSHAHSFLIVAMGHGFELLFAGIFLYRGVSGFACRSSIERPLYVMLGMFTIFYDLRFVWELLFDPLRRDIYLQGKGGVIDNDLVRVAQDYLSVDLNWVLWIFLFLTLLTPVLSLLLYRYRLWMLYSFARLFLILKI